MGNKNPKNKTITGIFVVVLVVTFMILLIYYGRSDSSTSIEYQAKEIFCPSIQELMLDYLKAPATAQFQDCIDAEYEINNTHIKITTYVDAENSFGALIRSELVATHVLSDNKWELDSLIFDNEVMFDRDTFNALKKEIGVE